MRCGKKVHAGQAKDVNHSKCNIIRITITMKQSMQSGIDAATVTTRCHGSKKSFMYICRSMGWRARLGQRAQAAWPTLGQLVRV